MTKNENKEAKRRAKELWEQSEEMFAGGDYLTARLLAAEIGSVAPDTDQGRKAAERVSMLSRVDPGALYALAATAALYLLAWAYAL
ncbi:MAG: hypothetical protein AAFQ82_02215 [Myxococcota bacterium]